MVQPDDTESTSVSTSSTLNGKYPQQLLHVYQCDEHEEQLHREEYEERPKYYSKKNMKQTQQRRSRPFLPPISAVRRISWDSCNLDRDGSNKTSNSSNDRRSRSTTNRRRRRRSGESFNSLRGSTMTSGSSNPQESLNGRHNEDDKKSSRAVTIGRELFVVFILITASVFGSMSY